MWLRDTYDIFSEWLSTPLFPQLWDTDLIFTEYAWKCWLEYQTSVRRPTLKIFGSSPSWLKSQTSVRRPTLKQFVSSPSRLSFDQRRKCWLTSQPSVLWPSQPLMTHGLDVCPPTVTKTKMSPFVCTAQD